MTARSGSSVLTSKMAFRWSARILLLGTAGILFLTLYPFRLAAHNHPATASALLLQGSSKGAKPFDEFLNVLLFIPYGFGFAGFLRRGGLSPIKVAVISLLAGLLFSYSIEFAQFFIPDRDSGWNDVFTNATGALTGAILLLVIGGPLLRLARRCEMALESHALSPGFGLCLAAYFAVCAVCLGYLQQGSSVRDWNPNSQIVVGSGAWNGQISALEFWDHPISGAAAVAITSQDSANFTPFPPSVAYAFQGSMSSRDRFGAGPDLLPVLRSGVPGAQQLDGEVPLASASPASGLIEKIAATGKFAIHLRFVPATDAIYGARLLLLSTPEKFPNLLFEQRRGSLALWFRMKTISPLMPVWVIANVCVPGQQRDMLFAYDGAKLWAYQNGERLDPPFQLGPASILAARLGKVKTSILQGLRYGLYAVVFFPVGGLLGILFREGRRSKSTYARFASLGIVLLPTALELILVRVGGQAVSAGNILLGIFLALAGFVWINVEGPLPAPS